MPAVLVISVLVMTVTAMAISLVTLDGKAYQEYCKGKQRILNLESALTVYRYDSSMFHTADSSYIVLYDEDSGIRISRKPWGLYEYVSVSDRYGNTAGRLYGRESDSCHEAAFWLCDRNRALTLDTGAVIDGPVYVPPNGINYSGEDTALMSVRAYPAKVSSAELPRVEDDFNERIQKVFMSGDETTMKYTGSRIHRSFSSGPSVIMASRKDSVFMLSGMTVLHGEDIVISGKSEMHDVIICAEKVTVRSGFRGCIQIFSRDSVTVESGAKLEWPSGICVTSHSGFPYVELHKGCSVSGYVAVTGAEPDMELRYPGYVQQEKAKLNGLLYADCSCDIEGDITGAAYVRDCFHIEDGIKYPGTISSASITRDDKLAFPVLMEGRYARKPIKRLL